MDAIESLELIKNDLVQVTEPNPTDIAEIVKRVVGGLPLREFGAKAGMSASTLSRIINEKITKPLTIETLMNIVISAETTPEETVALYKEIARANGMMSKSEQKALHQHMELNKQRDDLHATVKKLIFTVLLAALAERSISVNGHDDGCIFDEKGGYLKNITEMGIRYDTRMNIRYKGEHYTWILWAFPYSEEDYPNGRFNPRRIANQLVRELSPIFLTDSWKPELYADAKLTFCFVDENLFECFCHVLSEAKLNNRFSAVLINSKDLGYLKESIFLSAKYPDSVCLFSLPTSMMNIPYDNPEIAEELTGDTYLIYEEENREE